MAARLRNEYVVRVRGQVRPARPRGCSNPKMATGEIEVVADEIEILNEAKTPVFYINEDAEVDEALRLRYRYLDLRRERMQRNIILRHEVVHFIRDYLYERDFIEIETPILIKSTPGGGARLCGAQPPAPGQVLRPAAIAAAAQAAADGGRL